MIDVENRIDEIADRFVWQGPQIEELRALSRELAAERDKANERSARLLSRIGDVCSESMHDRAKEIVEG